MKKNQSNVKRETVLCMLHGWVTVLTTQSKGGLTNAA
jgi:hypothetical protein